MATFVQGSGTAVTSASPDYPISVISCGDKTVNLFNPDASAWTSGTYLTLKVCESTELAYIKIFDNDTSVNISGCYLGWRKEGTTSDIVWLIQNGQYSSTYMSNPVGSSYRSELYIYYSGDNIEGLNKLKQRFNLSCTKGSTIPTSYIPYGYQIPTVVGSNCGVVDMGTLNWVYRGDLAIGEFYATVTEKLKGNINLYCAKYTTVNRSGTGLNNGEICGHNSLSLVYIRDTNYTDTTAFKQAMSGVYLYYQRTTDSEFTQPTTTNIYLSDQLRKVGTYSDYLFWGEGKNLYDVATITNGYIDDTGTIQSSSASSHSGLIPCNANTTYSAYNNGLAYGGQLRLHEYDSDGNWIKLVAKSNNTLGVQNISGTTSANARYLKLSGLLKNNYGKDTMLVEGSTVPTTYEPYSKTPKVVRNVGVKTFTGDSSESWNMSTLSDVTDAHRYYCYLSDCAEINNVGYCSHFEMSPFVDQAKGNYIPSFQLGKGSTKMYLGFKVYDSTLSSASTAGWKAWLSDNPITVYYPLATPTAEIITDLPALPLKAGTDYITVNTTVIPSAMSLKAWQWRF